jgi:hypothetical protein
LVEISLYLYTIVLPALFMFFISYIYTKFEKYLSRFFIEKRRT